MKVGDWVETPRFCGVRIQAVFDTEAEAREAGFKQPTYYDRGDGWDILGKTLDEFHAVFAAVRKAEAQTK